jgi:hypothetical protein
MFCLVFFILTIWFLFGGSQVIKCEYAVRGEIVNIAQVNIFVLDCIFLVETVLLILISVSILQKLQEDLKTNKDAYPFDEVRYNRFSPFRVFKLDSFHEWSLQGSMFLADYLL